MSFQLQQMLQNTRAQLQTIESLLASQNQGFNPQQDVLNRIYPQAPTPVPAAAPAPEPIPVPALPNPASNGMQSFMVNQLLKSVGEGLTDQQQEWLTANLGNLPSFLSSPDGRVATNTWVANFQSYMSK